MYYKESLEKLNEYLLNASVRGREGVNSTISEKIKRDISIIMENCLKGNEICKMFSKEKLVKRRVELINLLENIPKEMKEEIEIVKNTINIIEGTINNYSLLQDH